MPLLTPPAGDTRPAEEYTYDMERNGSAYIKQMEAARTPRQGDEPFGRQRVIARMSDHGQLAAINAGLLVSCFAAAVKEPQPLLLRCGNHLEQNLASSQA